jgi:hypothetical protein
MSDRMQTYGVGSANKQEKKYIKSIYVHKVTYVYRPMKL